MDILRKELEEIYQSQLLLKEHLSSKFISDCQLLAENIVRASNGCAVITDAALDRCYIYSGMLAVLLGYQSFSPSAFEADSSDEDIIYERIHPEDLVDKRMLEYEFFKLADSLPSTEKLNYVARCRIRMRNNIGDYLFVDNTTQLITLSPNGKIWLILCTYSLSSQPSSSNDINASIINTCSGEVKHHCFDQSRKHLLSQREKEVLLLIKEGKLSKQIADLLNISVHTVNRHRQNILEKLSVANSAEAVAAATLMNLF